MTAYFHP